jgi:glycoside/pentoside/hexuronide:cation symporter, GPH family
MATVSYKSFDAPSLMPTPSTMATTSAPERLTILEKVGYGLGDTACNIVFQMVMSFTAFFYTDIFGLHAAAIGPLFLIARLLGALADPVVGAICDRTITRWGKFRPYLLWLCIPYALAGVLAFTTPDFTMSGKLVFAYVTYSLLMIIYSGINVPYCALGAVLTPDSRERVSLNGYRFFLATAGGSIVASTTLPLVATLGAGDNQRGFQLTMVVLTVLAVMMFLACFAATKERVVQASSHTGTLADDAKILLKNAQWRVVAAINLVLFAALAIEDSAAIYYLTWYVEREDLVGPFLTTGMVSSMIGAVSAGPLTKRLSKAASYSALQCVIVGLSIALFLTGPRQIGLLFVLYAAQQFFTQMASPILWSMTADSVDYGEFMTGRRITGLAFSGVLLSLKCGMAFGGAILGGLLAWFGYQSQATVQSHQTVFGIVLLFTLVPALAHAMLIAICWCYKLDDDRCDAIRGELAQRRAAATDHI